MKLDPKGTQRVPVRIDIIAVLTVMDKAAEDQATMIQAIKKTFVASLERIPYVASVEAIRVCEVEPAPITGRTQ